MKGYRRVKVGDIIKKGDCWYFDGKIQKKNDCIGQEYIGYCPLYRPIKSKAKRSKYPKRININEAVTDIAKKAKYYAGFDLSGKEYFEQFCKHLAKFIGNNYRRRRK